MFNELIGRLSHRRDDDDQGNDQKSNEDVEKQTRIL